MKRVLSIMLVLALCFAMCACGSEPKSMRDRAADAVKTQLQAYVLWNYGTIARNITTYVKEIGDNKFQVTGKVTIQDDYGDPYTGKYDATAIYKDDTGEFEVDYEVGKFYKD